MTEPKTKTLDLPGATLSYDVREAEAESIEPVLLMVGAPMDAGGFTTLAGHFPDRTVVTYDPRGVGRSPRADGVTAATPDEHAEDLHRLISELDARPIAALVIGLLVLAAIGVVLANQGPNHHAQTGAKRNQRPLATRPRPSAKHATTAPARSSATAAGSPPPTTSAGALAPAPSANTPIGAAESFYSLAAEHRYAQAWTLADPTFRSQLGGYQSFEYGQALDRSITFNEARVVSQTSDYAVVAVQTTSARTNGTQHCAGTIDLRLSGSAWLLHLIGINCT